MRAGRRLFVFHDVKKCVGLIDEQGVPLEWLDRLNLPCGSGRRQPSPAVLVEFKPGRAPFADDGQGHFVGALVLVQAEAV